MRGFSGKHGWTNISKKVSCGDLILGLQIKTTHMGDMTYIKFKSINYSMNVPPFPHQLMEIREFELYF